VEGAVEGELRAVPDTLRDGWRGIGRALVLATLERAKAEDLRVAFVPVDDGDAHAIAFYRAIGGRASPVTVFTFGEE
jgi:aminoglycoside 3-N-acetyltransferase I